MMTVSRGIETRANKLFDSLLPLQREMKGESEIVKESL